MGHCPSQVVSGGGFCCGPFRAPRGRVVRPSRAKEGRWAGNVCPQYPHRGAHVWVQRLHSRFPHVRRGPGPCPSAAPACGGLFIGGRAAAMLADAEGGPACLAAVSGGGGTAHRGRRRLRSAAAAACWSKPRKEMTAHRGRGACAATRRRYGGSSFAIGGTERPLGVPWGGGSGGPCALGPKGGAGRGRRGQRPARPQLAVERLGRVGCRLEPKWLRIQALTVEISLIRR